jgi:hypothetical protein
VIEDAADFYSSRIPKKQRKSTIVEELLADAEFRKYALILTLYSMDTPLSHGQPLQCRSRSASTYVSSDLLGYL